MFDLKYLNKNSTILTMRNLYHDKEILRGEGLSNRKGSDLIPSNHVLIL